MWFKHCSNGKCCPCHCLATRRTELWAGTWLRGIGQGMPWAWNLGRQTLDLSAWHRHPSLLVMYCMANQLLPRCQNLQLRGMGVNLWTTTNTTNSSTNTDLGRHGETNKSVAMPQWFVHAMKHYWAANCNCRGFGCMGITINCMQCDATCAAGPPAGWCAQGCARSCQSVPLQPENTNDEYTTKHSHCH